MPTALLLDIGNVIIGVSWQSIAAYEQATGVRMPTADGRRGEPTTADYWEDVARDAGLGGFRDLFRALSTTVPEATHDPDALALMHDARAARLPVGVLTNDAYAILGREYFASHPDFAVLDAFVDAEDIGVRKPDVQAYLIAAEALGVAPEAVVFLDDTPECADGARAAGMVSILVDPLDPRPAFEQARKLLGLQPGRPT
jgi:FMN phosphatase YigB (HAD superfamily)